MAEGMMIQLKAENVSLHFGGVAALSEVNIEVQKGEMFAIIGPNGAGKTSFLNCVSGRYRPQHGRILFEGHDITKMRSDRVAHLGVARTFQNIALFKGMSVLDNLMLGRHIHLKTGVFSGGIFFGSAQREEVAHRRIVEDIIDFLEIERIRKKTVGSLPYGFQKRVELGRALAMQPKLLLLDEPMAGMNVEEKEDMARFILDIHEEHATTIILIEHDMGVVMSLSQRVAVLDFGKKIAEGPPSEIMHDPEVMKAYLGEEESEVVA
jgi:branched-chain amino acid transport system ATP-binding protein